MEKRELMKKNRVKDRNLWNSGPFMIFQKHLARIFPASIMVNSSSEKIEVRET